MVNTYFNTNLKPTTTLDDKINVLVSDGNSNSFKGLSLEEKNSTLLIYLHNQFYLYDYEKNKYLNVNNKSESLDFDSTKIKTKEIL